MAFIAGDTANVGSGPAPCLAGARSAERLAKIAAGFTARARSSRANDMPDQSPPGIICREIGAADLPAVADLLREGFPNRTRAYWWDGLQRLAAHALLGRVPKFGHLLVAQGAVVGVVLMIYSGADDGSELRCNVSSWYVRPTYRGYAPLLSSRAVRNGAVTYVNISPAANTLSTIEAQGFSRAAAGCFIGVPALAKFQRSVTTSMLSHQWRRRDLMSEADARLLSDHVRFGCICLWLEAKDGGHPFIFRRRVLRLGRLPCAMLLYCRSLEELERFAGPVGRVLAQQGLPLVLASTDTPLRPIAGRLFPEKLPIYYKGALKPRSGDLSYTEAALFGM